MKPEDKVTADRLTPAGTTQTPLTDKEEYDVSPVGEEGPCDYVVSSDFARSLELALSASRAREAELVKALEVAKEDIEWSCGQLSMNPRDHTAWRVITAALTAPPTNSKEMNK